MQVIDAKFYENHPGQFSISVLVRGAYRAWVENLYAFKFENGKVYFQGGQGMGDKLAGEAKSQEEAIEKAIEYLEWWLKECRAISRFDAEPHFKINEEDNRGSGYFTLQVWARDKNGKDRRDILFTFVFENGRVYYLGDDKEERRDMVKFYYRPREQMNVDWKQQTKEELNVFPKDKEEAIRDAIDYLEWWLSEQGRL